VVVRFITEHHVRFGVEPICRVLTQHGCKIAPSTYYAAKSRPPSARARRDELVLIEVRRVHKAARGGLYGVLKVTTNCAAKRCSSRALRWLGAPSNGSCTTPACAA